MSKQHLSKALGGHCYYNYEIMTYDKITKFLSAKNDCQDKQSKTK